MELSEQERLASQNQEAELENLLQDLMKAQLALGNSLSSTSSFLRFVLSLAGENLVVIHSQLEAIRKLAAEISQQGGPQNPAS